jgi:hypothetical protein
VLDVLVYAVVDIKFVLEEGHSGVAQSVERAAVNRTVHGSSPCSGALCFYAANIIGVVCCRSYYFERFLA